MILTYAYYAGVILFFAFLVETDRAKRSREDLYICGVFALGWPVVIVMVFCAMTYLIANKLPPFDNLEKKK